MNVCKKCGSNLIKIRTNVVKCMNPDCNTKYEVKIKLNENNENIEELIEIPSQVATQEEVKEEIKEIKIEKKKEEKKVINFGPKVAQINVSAIKGIPRPTINKIKTEQDYIDETIEKNLKDNSKKSFKDNLPPIENTTKTTENDPFEDDPFAETEEEIKNAKTVNNTPYVNTNIKTEKEIVNENNNNNNLEENKIEEKIETTKVEDKNIIDTKEDIKKEIEKDNTEQNINQKQNENLEKEIVENKLNNDNLEEEYIEEDEDEDAFNEFLDEDEDSYEEFISNESNENEEEQENNEYKEEQEESEVEIEEENKEEVDKQEQINNEEKQINNEENSSNEKKKNKTKKVKNKKEKKKKSLKKVIETFIAIILIIVAAATICYAAIPDEINAMIDSYIDRYFYKIDNVQSNTYCLEEIILVSELTNEQIETLGTKYSANNLDDLKQKLIENQKNKVDETILFLHDTVTILGNSYIFTQNNESITLSGNLTNNLTVNVSKNAIKITFTDLEDNINFVLNYLYLN